MRGTRFTIASFLFLAAYCAESAYSQGLKQDEDYVAVEQVYPARLLLLDPAPTFTTYAHNPFTNYGDSDFPYTSSRRTFYGPLGDRLISGFDVVWWEENRSSTGDSDSQLLKHDGRYYGIFDNVVIASDATKSWSGRAIYGNEIRTMFTPLTFYWANLNGIRLDWMTERNRISVISSRISHPGYPRGAFREVGLTGPFIDLNPIYILGGHFERSLGVLNLGATYVNIHSTNLDKGEESLKGAFPTSRKAPLWLAIRVSDESPEDERGGPVVFDVAVWINGERRDDIRPDVVRYQSKDTSVGRTTADGRFTPNAYSAAFKNPPGVFRLLGEPSEIPLFADYLYLRDHLAGEDVSTRANIPRLTAQAEIVSDAVASTDGDAYLIYYFDMRDLQQEVDAVELGFLVGNDYQISISEVQNKAGRNNPYERQYRADFFRTIIRAPGNVQDLSNVRWEKFHYGAPTGLSIYSVNAHANFHGLEIEGEFASSLEYNQFPNLDLAGDRFNERGHAWYLVANKDFARWGLGGEFFSMQPDYRTYLTANVPNIPARDYTRAVINDTGFYPLVQDNDDHDRAPDVWFGETGRFLRTEDLDGIFPGKDEDQDGLPDTNKNYNLTPDYREPFLMFGIESDDYVYGADMDNNNVPDVREDDTNPEYPYDLDLAGAHLMGWVAPWRHLRLMLGRLHSGQIAGGRHNRVAYGRLNYRVPHFGLGVFEVEHEVKRVRDDIADETVRFGETTNRPFQSAGDGFFSSQFGSERVADELNYRNSLVHRTYLDTRLRAVPGLEVTNRIKLETNNQRESLFDDGTFQRRDQVRLLAGVHKVSYTWQSGPWRVAPQFKVLYLKKARRKTSVPLTHERQLIPILKAECRLTERTSFKGGIQGFPWLKYQLRDLTDPSQSVNRQNRILMVSNRSEYFGYQLIMNAGLLFDKIEFLDPRQSTRNLQINSMFMRIVLGYED